VFREIQRDPVTDDIIHVDIMGIQLTEKIRLSIPVLLIGTPAGVKEGGILEHLLREVEVEGLPLDIPEHIEVDVTGLNIGDVITLEHLSVDKVQIVTEIHHAVANVIHPKVVKEEVEEVEEEVPEEGEEMEEEKEAAPEEAESKE
jgi:large subunit ribosomal protein L25